MNLVEIVTSGPVLENLCQVVIRDTHGSDDFFLDNADVERAMEEGDAALLELVAANCGEQGRAILEAAAEHDSPVTLDGQNVSRDAVRSATTDSGATPHL